MIKKNVFHILKLKLLRNLILILLIIHSCACGQDTKNTKTIDSNKWTNSEIYNFKLQNDTAIQLLKFIRINGSNWKFELSLQNKITKQTNLISGSVHCNYIDDILIDTEKDFSTNPYVCTYTNNGIEYNFDITEGKSGLVEVIVSPFNPVTREELDNFIRLPMKLDK